MIRRKYVIVNLLAIILCVNSHERFDQNIDASKVYRVIPRNENQVELLRELETNMNLDFWKEVTQVGESVDIMVKEETRVEFLEMMKNEGIDWEILIEDLQRKLDAQTIGDYSKEGMTWDKYYYLPDINSWLEDLESSNPGIVKVIQGGYSYEDRNITGVKISYGAGRRAVFLEGGIHAREWISPATLTYIINEILTRKDQRFRRIAESFDWYIFPVTNPDGYVYTHWQTRYWRKTRTPNERCHGVDPNRNWDYLWMEIGGSNETCSDTFSGTKPFSDLVTLTLSNFIRSVASTLDVYISFHSYAQLLLIPYGHTTEPLDNYNETLAIGIKTIEALERRHGTKYRVGNVAEALRPTTGTSIDWVKINFDIPLVYVYEMRDTGKNGFLLPPEEIIPNGEEIVDSLIAMFEEAERLNVVNFNRG